MTRADIARSIIRTLRVHRAPPIYGFVNAKALDEGPDNVEVTPRTLKDDDLARLSGLCR